MTGRAWCYMAAILVAGSMSLMGAVIGMAHSGKDDPPEPADLRVIPQAPSRDASEAAVLAWIDKTFCDRGAPGCDGVLNEAAIREALKVVLQHRNRQ